MQMIKRLGAAVVADFPPKIFMKRIFLLRVSAINVKKENSCNVISHFLTIRTRVIEKFYVRDNITHQWITDNRRELVQFSSQRIAKRYAGKHLHRFTIVSFNLKTKKMKWRGGDRV